MVTQQYEVKARSAITVEQPSPDGLFVDLREYFERWLRSLENVPFQKPAATSPACEQENQLEADIEVGVALINGCVNGNIRASQRVVLQSQARVEGNIDTPLLSISDGAVFEGECNYLEEGAKPERPTATKPSFKARVVGA
ncbi:MAG: bactofilin family protein [Pyrinomonadaceae bacterium]